MITFSIHASPISCFHSYQHFCFSHVYVWVIFIFLSVYTWCCYLLLIFFIFCLWMLKHMFVCCCMLSVHVCQTQSHCHAITFNIVYVVIMKVVAFVYKIMNLWCGNSDCLQCDCEAVGFGIYELLTMYFWHTYVRYEGHSLCFVIWFFNNTYNRSVCPSFFFFF